MQVEGAGSHPQSPWPRGFSAASAALGGGQPAAPTQAVALSGAGTPKGCPPPPPWEEASAIPFCWTGDTRGSGADIKRLRDLPLRRDPVQRREMPGLVARMLWTLGLAKEIVG